MENPHILSSPIKIHGRDGNSYTIEALTRGVAQEFAFQFVQIHNLRTGRSKRKGEERYIAIGEVKNLIITVVYTLRSEKIRIISARKASKNERKKYREV